MKFDLSQFENIDSASFTVRRQNGDEMLIDGKPVTITMHGLGTKQQVGAEFKRTRAMQAAGLATLQGRQGRDAERDAFTREAQYLAECTISLDNWPGEGGALGIYMNPKLGYIAKQADEFMKEPANFMKAATSI